MKPDTVENCTVAPKPGSEMPTIWAMGDSHAGHLQGMLYELHEKIGVGVHLVETPGWSFPLPGQVVSTSRETRFSVKTSPDVETRRYRSHIADLPFAFPYPHSVNDLRPWLYRVYSNSAEELAEKGVSLVVTGPPPIFRYTDIRECSLDERENCRLERADDCPSHRPGDGAIDGARDIAMEYCRFQYFRIGLPGRRGILLPG